jgi:hypothetical protein
VLALALSDTLVSVLWLALPLSLALTLLESRSDALIEVDSEAEVLWDCVSESRCDTLVLALSEASLTDALWEATLSLIDADAERLADLLVLALIDCDCTSDKLSEAEVLALPDCEFTLDRLSEADLLALADSDASADWLVDALASLAMLCERLALADAERLSSSDCLIDCD